MPFKAKPGSLEHPRDDLEDYSDCSPVDGECVVIFVLFFHVKSCDRSCHSGVM